MNPNLIKAGLVVMMIIIGCTSVASLIFASWAYGGDPGYTKFGYGIFFVEACWDNPCGPWVFTYGNADRVPFNEVWFVTQLYIAFYLLGLVIQIAMTVNLDMLRRRKKSYMWLVSSALLHFLFFATHEVHLSLAGAYQDTRKGWAFYVALFAPLLSLTVYLSIYLITRYQGYRASQIRKALLNGEQIRRYDGGSIRMESLSPTVAV